MCIARNRTKVFIQFYDTKKIVIVSKKVAKLFQFTLEKQTYQKITQLFCQKKIEKKFIKLNFLSKNVAYESYTVYPIHTILRIKDLIKMLFSCLILIYYMSLLILIFQYLKEFSKFQNTLPHNQQLFPLKNL